MGVENFHKARHRSPHRLPVTRVQVGTEPEVVVDDLGEVVLAQVPKSLRQIVDDKPVVIGEVLVVHLRHFPAGEVEMEAVDERHVVTNDVRHWCAKRWPVCTITSIGCWVLPNIAMLAYPAICLLASLELPRLAVRLHHRDHFLGHLLEIGDLVEADGVPDLDHPFVPALLLTEEVRDRGRTGEKCSVR